MRKRDAAKSNVQHEPVDDRPAIGRRKRYIFIGLAFLLPVALMVATEAALRICGYGGHPPVVKVIGAFRGGMLATTYIPGAASYFDTSKGAPGSIAETTFSIPKPPNTVRIVLAGASAIKGYPQPPALANSAFLREMLGDAWPDRQVEVVNLGTTAVATFPVLDMLSQMLAYEADLVVIYAGHNEFYGAYGVASLQSGGNTPAAIRFSRWRSRLGLVHFLARLTAGDREADDGALMEVMVGKTSIPPDDPLRSDAARNVEWHIGEMIDRCKAVNVPVLVCTLATNERDVSPVGTVDDSHLPQDDRDRLRRFLSQAGELLDADPRAAIGSLTEALKIHPDHALAHYLMGRAWLAAEDSSRAAEHFRRAKDCDPMPWRAPTATIDAIVRAATSRHAPVCDVEKKFREASSDGCVGWELMDDHVHFSIRGQALLARCIAESLIDFDGPLGVERTRFEALAAWEEYAARLGANEYERYAVAHGLRNLFSVPFMQASNPGAFERWDQTCKRLLRTWPTYIQQAAQEWQDPKQHRLVRRPLSGFVARAMIREKRFTEAQQILEVAADSVPLFSTWNVEYVYFELLCQYELSGRLDNDARDVAAETMERARFLLEHGAGNEGLVKRFWGRLHQLRGEWNESIPLLVEARAHLWEMEKVACDAALIEAYVRTGSGGQARALAQDGAERAGKFASYYRNFLDALPPP